MKYLLLHKFIIILFIIILSIILFHSLSMADTGENSLFYYEMNLFHGYSKEKGLYGRENDSAKSIGIEISVNFQGNMGIGLQQTSSSDLHIIAIILFQKIE